MVINIKETSFKGKKMGLVNTHGQINQPMRVILKEVKYKEKV